MFCVKIVATSAVPVMGQLMWFKVAEAIYDVTPEGPNTKPFISFKSQY